MIRPHLAALALCAAMTAVRGDELTRDERIRDIVASLPVVQRKGIARQEAEIKKLRDSLKEPIIANGPSGPPMRKNLANARARLELMKKDPAEAAPVITKRMSVGEWGRLPSPLLVIHVAENGANLEHKSERGAVVVFTISGKPPADWKKGAKVTASGLFLVESAGAEGPVVSRIELPKRDKPKP